MIPIAPVLATAGAASAAVEVASVMAVTIKALYGIANSINDYLNDHIEEMKGAENPTISRTGRVLEMAKYGFGIGYVTPVAIIATGQLLLGNSLAALTTAATAATLTNPIAMTCASIGAIYYGWGALSDQERNEMIEKLSKGLEIGVELIKSVIRFVIDKTKELLSPKNMNEIKKYIGSAAEVFGKTLGDVTRKIGDVVCGSFDTFKKRTGETLDKTIGLTSNTYDAMKGTAGKAVDGTREAIGNLKSRSRKNEIE